MKKINVLFVLLFYYTVSFSQWGPYAEWTWMKGSSAAFQHATYGTLGGPSVSGNTPGALNGPATWIGSDGRLWMFGGSGYSGTAGPGYLNDLWVYDPNPASSDAYNWIWMGGSATYNQGGTYGTLLISAPTNFPGARQYPLSWTDASGNFWMFGGYGYDASTSPGYLNDLWEYNPSSGEWTWINGSNTISALGNYPAAGSSNAQDASGPGARSGSITWIDGDDLYLFGGFGFDATTGPVSLNDVWSYNITSRQWTYHKGNTAGNQPGSYGTMNTSASGNNPGGREAAYGWFAGGKLWLYGGYGYDASTGNRYLNDLWQYDPLTEEWVWLKGNSTGLQPANYGTIGTTATTNDPGARSSGVAFMDDLGNFGMFGGKSGASNYLNDIWKLNPTTLEWTWQKGDNTINNTGIYGTQGTPNASNKPGSRRFSAVWSDQAHGYFWLFGGNGYDDGTHPGSNLGLNDLWRIGYSVLPVKYISFTATKAYGSVQLDWVTAQEINTSMFIVERSTNGKDYSPIGNLAAAGNSNEQRNYHFVDAKPQQGVNYYRLKLINTNSNAEYSDVRQVTFTGGALSLSVVGNPFRNSLQFRVSSPTNEKATIQLSDINGKTLLQKPVELQTGDNVMSVDGSGFAAGIYILSVNSSAGLRQVKVVKQ
jgi:N-acetylneuraminic acid mutarotase